MPRDAEAPSDIPFSCLYSHRDWLVCASIFIDATHRSFIFVPLSVASLNILHPHTLGFLFKAPVCLPKEILHCWIHKQFPFSPRTWCLTALCSTSPSSCVSLASCQTVIHSLIINKCVCVCAYHVYRCASHQKTCQPLQTLACLILLVCHCKQLKTCNICHEYQVSS